MGRSKCSDDPPILTLNKAYKAPGGDQPCTAEDDCSNCVEDIARMFFQMTNDKFQNFHLFKADSIQKIVDLGPIVRVVGPLLELSEGEETFLIFL